MSDVYDEILNSSNIQSILEHYGLKVIRNKCTCPFHHDSHPSMSIHPNKGIAKCFACGASGNAISFIKKYENEINHNPISFKDAMKKAIEIQGLNITIPENNNIPLTEEQKRVQKLNNILKDAITISENNLGINNLECQNVLKYLKERKLSLDTIKSFHIGFNPSHDTITNELLKKYDMGDLITTGMIKESKNDYVDVFSNRITIPIFDQNGNPVGFGARVTDNSVKPKYLNTKETELFNKSCLLFNYHKAKYYAKNDEIILVEGYMDVISSKEMKIDNAVGIMGTAITKEHIDLIKKLKCEVTLCLDNDDAGKEAMIRIIPELLKAKLQVNILDISELGNYKDFGDLQIANITREQVYQTKISAFTFLLKYKYIQDKNLSVENIHSIYNKMCKDGLIKDTKDTLNFREYITNHSNYSNDEIDKIINPTEITQSRVERYKDIFFYYYIIGLIKNYATKHQDNILLKYIETGKLDSNTLMKSLDDEKYLKDDSLTVNIGSYIRDYLLKSQEYINFQNDKGFILEKLMNNVKSFDSKGNTVNLNLTTEQKELVLKQYNESFDNDIKTYIENNPDEFEEIFIANSHEQFEKLFPKSYEKLIKEQSVSRFKNELVMEVVRYGFAYPEDMKSAMSREFVNNGKFKSLLVFNNNKNILGLTVDSIKQSDNEIVQEIEPQKEIEMPKERSKSNSMSIFIKLSGKETETYKGIYLPVNEETQVYIPKQLYKKDDEKLEILNNQSSQAKMSEYQIDTNKHTKKWLSGLNLEEFYDKYFGMYGIQMEKEVMA